jgi:hypothetical protein
MKVLLINPIIGDFGRASSIVRSYMANHWAGEDVRTRYHSVIYASKDDPRPVAVWHSRNQITLYFGEPAGGECPPSSQP